MMFNFSKIYSYYLALFPLVIILLPKFIALLIIFFIPILIVGLKRKQLCFQFNWLNFAFVLLYLLYVFYCLFTRYPAIAGKYLEYKLSFLIFPLILSFVLKKDKLNVKYTLIGFVISCLILSILSFIHSFNSYLVTKEIISWLTVSFSYLHHPSYASVFFTIAIFIVWYLYLNKIPYFTKISSIFLTLIFVISIFLCLSLAGIIFFVSMLAVFFIIRIYQIKGKAIALLVGVLIPILLFSFILTEKHVRNEFQNAFLEAKSYSENPTKFISKIPESGSDVRLIMWTVTSKAIQKYPLGIGTGNVDEVLNHQLNQLGQKDLALKNYNPHNQYLQVWLEIGVFGLFVLLFICYYSLHIGIKYRNYLLVLICSSFLFNMLFESMLQRQSGIMFFTFGMCYIVAYFQPHKRYLTE